MASTKVAVEGGEVGVGDYVCFKWDIEQCAKVISISGWGITVEAGSEGFDGDYAGSATHKTLDPDECWVEEW